ncbi:Transcriptional regulatory protein ZraR [Aminobacter sp. MSH1]|nr:Transcriptional regulatory protein ZraR [Aminobacter sp. MSH1]
MGGSIVQRLELEGWRPTWWHSGQEALEQIAELSDTLELVICDIRLPDMSGEDVFNELAKLPNVPPFMFVTGFGEIDQAVRLMRSGAVDFMTKPFSMEEFLRRIELGRRPVDTASHGYVLGVSDSMHTVEDTLRRYAPHNLPVLITGETGSGKEVAARYLHQVSTRSAEPFVAVNCAAIPADLLESELFGHEKGSFTSASQRHLGYAERAAGGTLFLDEIGDMPPALQAKLLRLIEDGSFLRVGGEVPVPFKARVISATHQNLVGTSGRFREDLYFRLAVLPVEVPPLRSRPDDIAWLMDRFLADAIGRTENRVRGYSALAEEAALSHNWKGNIRELRNRVERAAAVTTGEWIMPGDLFPEQADRQKADRFVPLSDVRDAAERRQIERALLETGGHIAKAAGLLGISRTTLWEKMSRFGLADRERSES